MMFPSLLMLVPLLAQVPGGASPAGRSPGGLGDILIPVVGFGVIFYFLIIRPQRKKEKDHQTLVSQIKSGDEIVTTGGIHGRVTNVKEKTLMVKIADNVKVELEKSAVSAVVKVAAAGATAGGAGEPGKP